MKTADLSSISVLPPHIRRPSVVPNRSAESSVFGKSQAPQVRSQQQQQSQQSFSQGFSSRQPIYSQMSQPEKLGSLERENSAKRRSSLLPVNYPREESQNPSANYMHKWSAPEYKCQITGDLELKIGTFETSSSRLGMILDSVQSDIMQVNRGTKEILREMESLRSKLVVQDELLQLMNKGREDLKAYLEGTFKSMFEELKENKYQEIIRDLSSLLRAMPNEFETLIFRLQTDLSKTLAKEIQAIALHPDCPRKIHEIAPVPPLKGISDCIPPPEVKFQKDQKTSSPKNEMGSLNTVEREQTCSKRKLLSRSHKQNEAFHQERELRVAIESDEDIDRGFSCLLEENGTGTGAYLLDDAAREETARILRKARKRKRKRFNTIIID